VNNGVTGDSDQVHQGKSAKDLIDIIVNHGVNEIKEDACRTSGPEPS